MATARLEPFQLQLRGSGQSSTCIQSLARPASSLTWCLAHLYKPGPEADHQAGSLAARDTDKKSKVSQWRALVAIRTQHIKGDKAGIARFRGQGGLRPLLNLLKQPECSRKTLDLALSILANCCTELETRVEVRQNQSWLDIMKRNVALESVQNRAARALGNLAMDPESSALIHSAGGVPLLLLCVSLSSAPSSPSAASPSDPCPKLECAQSAARALLYLSDSPSNRLSLLTQGALSALAPLIAPEYPHGLRRAALRTLHELTRGCGVECAKEVSRSGVLAQLGVMASGESDKPFEELALKTLANLCSQGCMRPLVGSLGVIGKFTEEVKRDSLKSGVFFKALCLCCKEAVNRAKVKESGGLEVLIKFLSSYQSHPLSRLAILACVDFVFDESAMEQLQEFGLVPLLVARLVKLTRGEEKVDGCLPSNMSPNEREQGSSSFLSLRSWLLSEGLISSEGELLDSSSVDFSSPQKRRRAPPAASATQVAVESPPPAPRSAAYHHPYHPEPWTPESPILLLLSRFSHAGDPSAALVSPGVVSGLLFYLTQHQDPSSRCFRMLCRLSCNPNCLQALLRTGSVSLIRHHLCLREEGSEGRERQTDRVKARVKQLGEALLRNLRVQCESGFGSGVLAHVMLSGSESDRINCALSLPFISSNKSLLRKLLLDSGGLRLALRPLGVTSQLHSLYFSLLTGCLSALMSTVQTHQVKQNTAGGDSPPPVKRPRLAAACPYEDSDFDLVLQLDDGTRVRANREAVAGLDGSDGAGSEYFRALLRGGFGEAQGGAEEAIRIKDVSAGMLLPVLHYLHGCRLGRGPQCFQNTPLGEVMVGACRFLVAELQRELEEVLVSFLSSCSTNRHKPASTGDNAEKTESKMDKECREPAEENLASLTSELELTGRAKKLKTLLQQAGGEDASFAGTIQDVLTGLNTSLDKNTIKKVISDSKPVLVSVNKSLDPEEKPSGPKNSVKLVSAAGSEALAALLPRLYCFSQRYNYPSLGRACLSLLLGCQDGAADCLRRLAREADSREALKQDLLGLVSAALI
uniref:Armadillo repeat containing 5 n=1 Tax=Kryptolebias marmoratus TaxID=37003 RepID=A0A3Q3A6X8_KRYMA